MVLTPAFVFGLLVGIGLVPMWVAGVVLLLTWLEGWAGKRAH